MNRFQTNLRIPGPTSLPDAVREAGARQMAMLSVLEESLAEFGRPVELGAGVAAAQRTGLAVARGELTPELATV